MQQTTAAYLVIQLGNRWSDVLRLQPEQVVLVGRSSECQILVKDERVSRKHAKISPLNGGWQVQDLGSRNGTQVQNQTIEGPHRLSDGEIIEVGGCRMTFSVGLASGFPTNKIHSESIGSQKTQEVNPTIVNRIRNSQWSAEGISAEGIIAKELPENATGSSPTNDSPWGFFYRLISDLVTATSPEDAAGAALEQLLGRLFLSYGGIVTVSQSDDAPAASLAVMATRQGKNGAYHRVSDFLVDSVLREGQAVLARNVRDDSKLSVARESGQREVVSIICAPIRVVENEKSCVKGLLHVYTAGDERMLNDVDLEIAVGVADNLGIALTRLQASEDMARSLETSRRRAEQLEEQLDQSTILVGESEALSKVRTAIERAGPTNATVLVRGESGVGKELVARGIHKSSKRKDGPLICLNCAALAPSLLESELFGHEKGAFTGATDRKFGKFEAANGGTLLLDEIGEMSGELQAKFLRVLEGQPFERLGGNQSIQTDVRVIAATNRDLEEAVKAKEFRADLFFRLRVIEIDVPPLRERKDDITLLVEHFVDQLKHHAGRRLDGIAPEALEMLTRHNWPGNIRELKNVIERAVVLGVSSVIQPEDLSLVSLLEPEASESAQSTGGFRPIPLAELEKEHIYAMLEHANGNKTKASQMLGIERSTLDRKLKRYKES
ncbi:MAG: sigma 54-interacting transcriptional regulator [Planctomycetota bacterium]